MTPIEELWVAVAAETREHRVFRRVDDTHPLDLYAGINQGGHRVLLLVTHKEPLTVPLPGAVEVIINQREDGAWAVVVQLARTDLSEIFGRLCQDLVEATRSSTREQGADDLVRRLHRWRSLLEPSHHKTLSEYELRGLIGELWVLGSLVLPNLGLVAGVRAWLGPLDAPQDFLLADSLLEVKIVEPNAQTVTISSLQQLETASLPISLCVVFLSSADITKTDVFTPAALVGRIRATLEPEESARNEFDLRLSDAGYVDDAEYVNQEYRVTQEQYFRVNEGFPRLTRFLVPKGVETATYEISLRACAPYEYSLERK